MTSRRGCSRNPSTRAAPRALARVRAATVLSVLALLFTIPLQAKPTLEESAKSILANNCLECHGEKRKSGLDLRTKEGLLQGGKQGPAIVAEKSQESLLYKAVARLDPDLEMPPEQPLSEQDIKTLADWIDAGAPWADSASVLEATQPSWWAFRKPMRPPVPNLREEESSENPIDAFILAKLEEKELEPAPLADRWVLIRRAYFDLIGLPPPPEKVEAFVNDSSPDAYEKLIDELLASPQYGERWARHWLDVVRYADTGGYETDIYYPYAWRYRDYVIKSLNEDKPYDRFLQEQIAGDELWPNNLDLHGSYEIAPEKLEHLEARIGTGLYGLGTLVHESNLDGKKLRNERLTDWVDTTASAFMGVTLGCARCHDHKFDPFFQSDYYAMQAIFANSVNEDVPIAIGMAIADYKQYYPGLLSLAEARKAYELFQGNVEERRKSDKESEKIEWTDSERNKKIELQEQIAKALLGLKKTDAQELPFDAIYQIPRATVLSHLDPELVPEIRLLQRGELEQPGDRIDPAIPAVFRSHGWRLERTQRETGARDRKQLALWLSSPDHPLTARVLVNRLWGWHFGQCLVRTPNDFGRKGEAASHPELLDWLATEFVARGWSVKAITRLMMLSEAYRRVSAYADEEASNNDPDNRLLWKMNRHRLEGESLWDAMHSVAGSINLEMYGPPVVPPVASDEQAGLVGWSPISADPNDWLRRGIYIQVRRNATFPLFEAFDNPTTSVSCPVREVTTVPPQALWFLNNETSLRQAETFANRLVSEEGNDPDRWISRAWELSFSRVSTMEEKKEALDLIDRFMDEGAKGSAWEELPSPLSDLPKERATALVKFCLTLFNLNEFVFVD